MSGYGRQHRVAVGDTRPGLGRQEEGSRSRLAGVPPAPLSRPGDLGAVTGGQARLGRQVKVGLAVLLGAIVVGLIVAVVVLSTDSGGGGEADPGSTHAAAAPASSGSAPAATPTTPAPSITTAPAPTASTTTPTTTTTTPTTTSTSEGVIP